MKTQKIFIEAIQIKKKDGSKTNVPIKPSNLQIIELNLDDRKRKIRRIKTTDKVKQKEQEAK